MDFSFVWQQSHLTLQARAEAEAKIREDLSSPHSPIALCHPGAGLVSLATSGPVDWRLVGNVKCNCGKPVGVIEGSANASTITLRSAGVGAGEG